MKNGKTIENKTTQLKLSFSSPKEREFYISKKNIEISSSKVICLRRKLDEIDKKKENSIIDYILENSKSF